MAVQLNFYWDQNEQFSISSTQDLDGGTTPPHFKFISIRTPGQMGEPLISAALPFTVHGGFTSSLFMTLSPTSKFQTSCILHGLSLPSGELSNLKEPWLARVPIHRKFLWLGVSNIFIGRFNLKNRHGDNTDFVWLFQPPSVAQCFLPVYHPMVGTLPHRSITNHRLPGTRQDQSLLVLVSLPQM